MNHTSGRYVDPRRGLQALRLSLIPAMATSHQAQKVGGVSQARLVLYVSLGSTQLVPVTQIP
jgi:hypothetical protein